jgi:hypothetical protein
MNLQQIQREAAALVDRRASRLLLVNIVSVPCREGAVSARAVQPIERAADQNTLFFLATSLLRMRRSRISGNFSGVPRRRGTMLMRNRVVLATSLILIFRCAFLHCGIFTFWIIVLHRALFCDLGGQD